MPMIKQFSEIGPVGVLKPCCTMLNVGTPQSDISVPWSSKCRPD
jgi:hypothetical protein